MKVSELIQKLQELPQDLPVFYVMFDDGYNITPLTPKDIVSKPLEDNEGKEFMALTLGEGWLGVSI